MADSLFKQRLRGNAIPLVKHDARLSVADCLEYLALRTEPHGAFDYEFGALQIVLGCTKVSTRWNGRGNVEQGYPGMSRVLPPERIWGEWQGEGLYLGAYISTNFIERSFEQPFRAMNFAHGRHDSPVIEHLLRAIDANVKQGSPAGPLFVQSVVLSLLRYLLRAPRPGAKGGLSSRQLRTLMELIEAELAGGIDVEQLARAAGVSAGHLSRAFKASTGLSPHQYVLRRRLERAKWLIREGGYSLQEIAERVGFADGSHMAAVFLRILGKPPSEYRKG